MEALLLRHPVVSPSSHRDYAYSKGDIVGNKMEYVIVTAKPDMTDEEIAGIAKWSACSYEDLVKAGPGAHPGDGQRETNNA